jgi:hypothetical protein
MGIKLAKEEWLKNSGNAPKDHKLFTIYINGNARECCYGRRVDASLALCPNYP